MITRPEFRLAAEHYVEPPPQPGQAHRAVLTRIIDYALPSISGDRLRAIATVAGQFSGVPGWKSPWHFHECDLQIGMIVDGSLDLAYEAGRISRASKGDILLIPGKVLHDVGAASPDYQIVELTLPGSFSTIESSPPDTGAGTVAVTLSVRDALLAGALNGLKEYRYAMPANLADRYAIRRWVRDRNAGADGGWQSHDDECRITCVTRGTKTVETSDGRRTTLAALDLALMPARSPWRDSQISDDYEAVEIALQARSPGRQD